MNEDKETDFAWAAGFFDGEGHVRYGSNKKPTSSSIQIAQKTTECLLRLQKIFGVGTIGGPYHTKHPCYFWYVTSTRDVDHILTKMWPYLSEPKKKQAIKAGFTFGYIRQPKYGKPFNIERTKPICHPNMKHVAKGLCTKCYYRNWTRSKYEIPATKWRVRDNE